MPFPFKINEEGIPILSCLLLLHILKGRSTSETRIQILQLCMYAGIQEYLGKVAIRLIQNVCSVDDI